MINIFYKNSIIPTNKLINIVIAFKLTKKDSVLIDFNETANE